MMHRNAILSSGALALALAIACSSNSLTSTADGTVLVKLTDAPFLKDSLTKVDIFVLRVEARTASTDSAEADSNLDNSGSGSGGWKTIASPNASYNLLTLQNGTSATLGTTPLAAGTYSGLRFIIDPSKSSVTLKNGMVLSGSSSPSVTFPSASRSGIKVKLSQDLTIVAGATTTLLVDFDVNDSFVMRGNTIDKNGLLFKPTIKATITQQAAATSTR